ncbi:short chain enoyl-CoA hydratase [Nannocystis exedens]|uniref:Short chain enoyl-CoA hydratase n=1 Tax=Nannocystis exedens TaxID=54 RepID=A0A1I2GA43_9BACT|nr:enoyl-CoA hydratase-related protein [Nannocystis exedens]PCC67372.1 enoyl-CoA hydratase [Nannocystis exedens]SFF14043.1 short chain enoyl-CoA hydratase [Nannocystis exedens]
MLGTDTLLVSDDARVRVVTISRPKALNALNPEVIAGLSQVLDDTAAAARAGDVRALVLTGAGEKSFVAGADIAAMADMSVGTAREFARAGHGVGEALAGLPIPTIAAVHGFALGGGCELALACDFIYAAENAKFGQPEVKLGVIPGFGGTQRLARRVGLARALELCLTGDTIDAAEAARIGLVNRVLPAAELLPAALATARKIAEMGPVAVAEAKRVLHAGAGLPLAQANALEIEAFAGLFDTADQKEGMAAFLGKRKPEFRGQ